MFVIPKILCQKNENQIFFTKWRIKYGRRLKPEVTEETFQKVLNNCKHTYSNK